VVQPAIKKALDTAYPVLPDASFNPDIAGLLAKLDRSAGEKWPRF
jgi:hypothetical protein